MAKIESRGDEAGEAEIIALNALTFLASDPHRFEAFLALSGLSVTEVAARAGERGFQRGVLEHLMANESLLVAFCAENGLKPEAPGRALRRLDR
jgi:hypothetical protein